MYNIPMKKVIYLFLFALTLNSSTIQIVKMRADSNLYYILELTSSREFFCKRVATFDNLNKIECNLNLHQDENKSFEFFSLEIADKVVIKPKYKYKIIPFKKKNNYVDIVFFKKDSGLFEKNEKDGLNFNINFDIPHRFYISVLDENLRPDVTIRDAHKVNFIKSLYKKKDYESAIKSIDREIKRNNSFKSDLILLKIQALDKLLDLGARGYKYEDIIKETNTFMSKYPSSSKFTQVMYYKIKSLFKIGKRNKAIFLTDKLNNSFKKDKYTSYALILKANSLSRNKKTKLQSYKILKDLLYNTDDMDIALKSAYLLTKYSLDDKNVIDAKFYLNKILKSKPEYLKKNRDSYAIAEKFAFLKDYLSASKIMKVIVGKKPKKEYLKSLAIWEDKAGLKESAYKNYKRYIKLYPKGEHISFIKEKMDKVLLDVNETNNSKKLEDIDKIIKNYSNDPIYKKALIQKVKLLEKNKKYKNILKLQKRLMDINESKYINSAASQLFKKYIDSKNCIQSVKLVDKYKIRVDTDNDLYMLSKCYYDLSMYKESSELGIKYIKGGNNKSLDKWYYLTIKSLVKFGKYEKALKIFDDFKKIVDIDKSKFSDIYYSIFEVFYNTKQSIKMQDILRKIEQIYPNRVKNLDLYYKIVKFLNVNKSNTLLVTLYAKKLLKLQSKLKVYPYSPNIDILLIKALMNLNKNKEALSYFASTYLDKKKNDTQKAELLYLAGEASEKLKKYKQAKEFFSKCGSEIKDKMWIKLCSESLKLIDDE